MLLAFERHNKLMAEAQEGKGAFTLWPWNFHIFPRVTGQQVEHCF